MLYSIQGKWLAVHVCSQSVHCEYKKSCVMSYVPIANQHLNASREKEWETWEDKVCKSMTNAMYFLWYAKACDGVFSISFARSHYLVLPYYIIMCTSVSAHFSTLSTHHYFSSSYTFFAGQIMDRTPTSLVQLKRCVAFRIADRWHDIGIQLKFGVEELDQIDKNNQSPKVEECCKAMLYSWKRRTTGVMAKELIDAIEEAGNAAYASQLTQGTYTICKYCNSIMS